MFDDYDELRRLRSAWDTIKIVRSVRYSLFTFGESVLDYFLVTEGHPPEKLVKIRRGEVKVTRPLIIRPDNDGPEFLNFFDGDDEGRAIEFMMSRTAAFSNLRFTNQVGPERIVSDQVEEAIAKLERQLDSEDEDRVAIISAPARLAGMAILKYTADRVVQSAPDNLQELRERGLLPE
ncbi:MAG: hypothetical protein JWM11_4067 [Planctomycetaceae bacterium]|nr:hypothetical protein [Planctomycetaceae bacterium]